ncbi:MAG: MMPL family transporter [Methylococcaceae bacterium]|nr:MMPL family transporter [Methylococcaceae bacterium]
MAYKMETTVKKNKFTNSLAVFVTTHPWWTILFSLIFIALFSAGIQKLDFKNNYRVYFGEENPQLKAFDAMQATYNKSDNVMFVIAPKDGNVFTIETLAVIKDLTKNAWQIPYSSRVDSITNYQHTVAEEDDLIVSSLVMNPAALTPEKIAEIKQVALNEPLLVNRLISKTGHATGVSVTLQLPDKKHTESGEVAMMARKFAADIEAKNPNIKVYLSGMAMMNNAFAESAISDNTTLMPIMYAVVIGALLLCLHSFTGIFSVILLILFSVLTALGIAGWLGIFLTPTSAISPTIILTMAVADCVHILVTFLHNMRLGHEKHLAMQESLRINMQPVFLTSLTTAIGFMSMNFSDAPPFRDLGNIVALGVIFAWIFSMTLLPALMMVLPVRVRPKDELDNRYMLAIANFTIKRRKPLLIINGLIAIILSSLIPLNEINDEFVKFFDETTEFRQGTDFLNENMGGIYTIEFSVHAKDTGGVNEPLYLKNLQTLGDWLSTQKQVVHVNSVVDTFKRLNKNMHADNPAWYKLPEERELAAQYLLLYEMSLPYGLDLNDQINIDKSGVRVIATIKTMSSNEILALEAHVQNWIAENLPNSQIEMASPVLMFAHIGQRNIVRMIGGTIVALVLISFLLMLAFKSLRLGFLSLIPNLVPAGVGFGIWGVVNGQVGLGLSVVAGMTLGIVVDDTVHFISKYQRARVEKGLSPEDAVRYAFSTVGVALWITSLVLVSGFLVLNLSHFSMNADMGLMTAITIASALFLDLLFLPPLLMTMEKK